MAKNNKPQNLILKMTSQDIKLARTLVDCRYAPCGIVNYKRERQWIKCGYLKKVSYMEGKKSVPILEITKRGWGFLQKCPDINVTERYISKKDAKLHDIAVLKEWERAMAEGKLWFNETQNQNMLEDRKKYLISVGRSDEAARITEMQKEGLISAPDGLTLDPITGEYEVVEVITRNYTDADIEAKREWARAMGIKADFECIKAY